MRPLVLIPSSKAKADGGDGPAYRTLVQGAGPLADARRQVLAALAQAATDSDDRMIARLGAVPPAGVDAFRTQLRTLGDAPTMPAHRRYTGVVHRFAQLDTVDPARAGVDVATLTGLSGLVMLDEPVPDYRLEVMGRVPALGVLRTWWRAHLGVHLRALAATRPVWDLLPGEFGAMWPPAEREGIATTTVTFRRPDGRAAPSASAKVAKGHLVRVLLGAPSTTADDLAAGDLLDGWTCVRTDAGIDAIQRS